MRLPSPSRARRITPASAGSRCTTSCPGRPVSDHPRVGGEQDATSSGYPGGNGSPPRRRGAVGVGDCRTLRRRITPASAGSRARSPNSPTSEPDHPRVGGEQVSRVLNVRMPNGSPPRRRGADCPPGPGARRGRITPASAGSSSSSWSWARRGADHPRVGGEQSRAALIPSQAAGSPPRRRGAVLLDQIRTAHRRITPASAGSRLIASWPLNPAADHPRVGGEQEFGLESHGDLSGSPPRRRGAVDRRRCSPGGLRITPASAGSSCST